MNTSVKHETVIFITTTIEILYYDGTISHNKFGLDLNNVGTRGM
jgi:hypothetical protein